MPGKRKRGRPKETWRDCGQTENSNGFQLLGRGRIGGSKQGILEEHDFQPYSPHREKELMMIICLAPQAGKMDQTLHCNGYLSGQDGAILPTQDYPSCLTRKISRKAI